MKAWHDSPTEFGDPVKEPMLERSGDGPYGDLARAVAKGTDDIYGKQQGSPPSVIADGVAEAIAAKTPNTRYAEGHLAKPLIAMRGLLPDRAYDALVMSQTK